MMFSLTSEHFSLGSTSTTSATTSSQRHMSALSSWIILHGFMFPSHERFIIVWICDCSRGDRKDEQSEESWEDWQRHNQVNRQTDRQRHKCTVKQMVLFVCLFVNSQSCQTDENTSCSSFCFCLWVIRQQWCHFLLWDKATLIGWHTQTYTHTHRSTRSHLAFHFL